MLDHLENNGNLTAISYRRLAMQNYANLTAMLHRLQRRHLDVVRTKLEASGVADISPTQAMLLIEIGEGEVQLRDLVERRHYLASTATYNVRKLVDSGYVEHMRGARDRRVTRLRLTERGAALLDRIESADEATALADDPAIDAKLDTVVSLLHELDRSWFQYLSRR